MRDPARGRMVAREPRRASPATKRMREAFTCETSGSLRAMSATIRRQRSVAFGRGGRRARTVVRTATMIGFERDRSELLGSDRAGAHLGSVHLESAGPAERAAHRE